MQKSPKTELMLQTANVVCFTSEDRENTVAYRASAVTIVTHLRLSLGQKHRPPPDTHTMPEHITNTSMNDIKDTQTHSCNAANISYVTGLCSSQRAGVQEKQVEHACLIRVKKT